MIRQIIAIFVATILATIAFATASFADNDVAELYRKVNRDNIVDYSRAVEDIAASGDAAVADLLSVLTTAPPARADDDLSPKDKLKAKVTAMEILGEIQNPSVLPTLDTMFNKSGNHREIYNSARTIGKIGGPAAFQILAKALKKSKSSVSANASQRIKASVIGLGLCGEAKAIPLLKAELKNTKNDKLTRIYASGSLGMLGSKEGYSFALASVNSESKSIRMGAIRALGYIGNPAALDLLNRIDSENNKYSTRKLARASIVMIKSSQLSGDEMLNHLEIALSNNPRMNEMAHWGTLKLKKVNTKKSRKVLTNLADISGPGYFSLRHAAAMKIKTMKKESGNKTKK